MEKQRSPEQMHTGEGDEREKRVIRKPCEFLKEVGITDFYYEEQEDGVHFFIKLPPEHIEQRKRQVATNLNAPDHTDFEAGPLLEFKEKLNQTVDLAWRFGSQDESKLEIVISKTKKLKNRRGGYINP